MLFAKKSNKKFKITRLIRMHANEMEDVEEVFPGDIFCTFGLLVDTGETVTDGRSNIRMEKMYVPEPVMSMSLKLDDGKNIKRDFTKAIEKFTREDPTFTYEIDDETGEMIVKGMGELHLQIYSERLKREFGVKNQLGEPQVNYREAISSKIEFNYLHKKQSGGAGQFGRVIGYFEPIDAEDTKKYNEFIDQTTGMNIPKEYIPAIEKGFLESCKRGPQTGFPVMNCRFVLLDGETHSVDSSSNAFSAASRGAFRNNFDKASPLVLQPFMSIEVYTPSMFQSSVLNVLTKRRAQIININVNGESTIIECEGALSNMFGIMTDLRSVSQGQAE